MVIYIPLILVAALGSAKNMNNLSQMTNSTAGYIGDTVVDAAGTIVGSWEYGLRRSTDDGVSFSDLPTTYFTNGLGAGYGNAAIYGIFKAPNGALFAATEHDGISFSTDSGASWAWLGIDEVNPGQVFPFGNPHVVRFNASGQPVVGTGFGAIFVHTGAISPITCEPSKMETPSR